MSALTHPDLPGVSGGVEGDWVVLSLADGSRRVGVTLSPESVATLVAGLTGCAAVVDAYWRSVKDPAEPSAAAAPESQAS